MGQTWMDELAATQWAGIGELWLDPEGNQQERYDCTLAIAPGVLSYRWYYDSEEQQGSFVFFDGGATWTDSWHQPESANGLDVPNARGLFAIEHSYSVPSSPEWAWRSQLSERPDGSLVLQMTNITPWGEEGRAVRMVFMKS